MDERAKKKMRKAIEEGLEEGGFEFAWFVLFGKDDSRRAFERFNMSMGGSGMSVVNEHSLAYEIDKVTNLLGGASVIERIVLRNCLREHAPAIAESLVRAKEEIANERFREILHVIARWEKSKGGQGGCTHPVDTISIDEAWSDDRKNIVRMERWCGRDVVAVGQHGLYRIEICAAHLPEGATIEDAKKY